MINSKKLNVIDLFAGVGGLTYGFYNNPKFKVIAANEILPDMAKAYSLNHPDVKMYCNDVKNFNFDLVQLDLGIKKGDVDIIVGGPPCQAYSTLGKRLPHDPRGKLFQEYYRILKEFDPRFFVFENVCGLLSMQVGELFKTIINSFESLGYFVKYELVNAVDFGAPQVRKRVIITGSKINDKFEFPKRTHGSGLLPYVTLSDAISDLPFMHSGEEAFEYRTDPETEYQKLMRRNAPNKIMDQNSAKNSDKLVRLMKLLPDGGSPKDLPKELRPKSGYGNTYCKLWWHRPSTTVTRNLGTPSSSRCIHPKANRALSTREGARLQGFPDDYKFFGSRSQRNLQIGNAVPTQLSITLANFIVEYFNKYTSQKL